MRPVRLCADNGRAGYGKRRGDSRTIFSRLNLERASKLSCALPHPTKPDTAACPEGHGKITLTGYSFTLIGDLKHKHFFIRRPHPNACCFTSRMAVDIGQAFLHDSKDRDFPIRRKPAYVR